MPLLRYTPGSFADHFILFLFNVENSAHPVPSYIIKGMERERERKKETKKN